MSVTNWLLQDFAIVVQTPWRQDAHPGSLEPKLSNGTARGLQAVAGHEAGARAAGRGCGPVSVPRQSCVRKRGQRRSERAKQSASLIALEVIDF